MKDERRYSAFLSYSHADEALAARLHSALERFRIPKAVGATRRTLAPVFRDRAELGAAASLPDVLMDALRRSDHLIIIASEASRTSHWVNAEIRAFRDMHGEGTILCASVDGSADAFPPALLECDSEPLAADLSGRNFRTGVLQLAAAMLGVGLDALVQRDLSRLRRRVMAVTAASALAVSVMGLLTWSAVSARQLAEQRRDDAEGQIEFMITDLKDELEAIGRLKPLDAVGERAIAYYANYPIETHDADALGRRSRVFHMLGDVSARQGEYATARDYFQRADAASAALLADAPDDADRVFDHAQSAFWLGYSHYSQGDFGEAAGQFRRYAELADRLADLEGRTERALQERIYALTNLAVTAMAMGETRTARDYLQETIVAKAERVESVPENVDARVSVANSLLELAGLEMEAGVRDAAETSAVRALSYLQPGAETDFRIGLHRVVALRSIAGIQMMSGAAETARSHLDIAFDEADTLFDLEPDSVDLAVERLELESLAFQLAYIDGDAVAAESAHDDIVSRIDRLPEETRDSRRVERFANSVAAYPLYLAILAGDATRTRKLAERVLDDERLPFEDRLLVHAALERDYGPFPDCGAELGRAGREALTLFAPHVECADATDTNTLFAAALGRLPRRTSGIPQERTDP